LKEEPIKTRGRDSRGVTADSDKMEMVMAEVMVVAEEDKKNNYSA
jgi:hypothetical protein